MNKYRFNEARHLHELNVNGEWKALTGCTTILSVLAKPALIQWSANMAVEFIQNIWAETEDKSSVIWPTIFDEAKYAHRKKKEKAGEAGTDVHALIEKEIKNAIENTKGFFVEKWKEQYDSKQIIQFIEWAVKNKVKFLESEKNIYSEKYFTGGIVDIVCEIDGQIWIADIKTGSGIYPEHFWQMSGYQIMLEELGFNRPIIGHIVLNLKKDGSFQEKRSVSNEDNKKGFLACLEIYRIQEKIKNQVIN